MSRFCTHCGARLDDNARFCTSCGKMIESLPEQPQIQQPEIQQPQTPEQPVWTQPVPVNTGAWQQPVDPNPTQWTGPQQPVDPNTTQWTGPAPTLDPNQPTGDPNWNPDPPEQPPQWPPESYPGNPGQPQGGRTISKGALIGILCGVLALIGVLVAIPLLLNRVPTLDLNKYYQVTFNGNDGYGNAEIKFDSEKLLKDYEKKFSTPEKAHEFVSFAQYMPSLSKTYELKNDETVTLQWDMSEEDLKFWKKYYGVEIQWKDKEIKVAGLTPIGTFDAFASVDVSFEGNDGSGRVRVDQKDDEYYYYLSFDCDSYDGLSNGDTVTVTCRYEEAYMAQELGKVPEAATKQYTVEGLGEIKEINPFDHINIRYEGVSPELTAYVEFNEDAPQELKDAVYIDNSYIYDLKNGDEITIEVKSWSDDAEIAQYYGIKVTEWSKTYTVEAEQEYVTKLADIDDSTLERLKKIADQAIQEEADDEYGDEITMVDHSYIGLYLMTPKNDDMYYTQQNYLYVLYKIDITSKNGGAGTYYYYLGFENLIKNRTDGEITFREDYYNTPSSSVRAGEVYLSGYDSLDTFRQSAIEYNSDSYNYETNVK
ncbi:MAG: zinc ribbon domain-containing protein [Clostridiales bacterium]|nr:zinc ribbon domain-containing protein [Clostridiales bacterium]